ncbi:MAG: septation protein IspZ [Phenylobacterium sp.]|uniref:inner membrane-spanning protein YciB n=1 Tax=Phenylobacterium sp. TaxID=1871053 RepID=UPI001A437207|nr:septation protein IspZ [Phenylobacterium sp.]MBL8553599.1 septation protein IspZ [Phenylobacterium sp.]
MGNLMHAGRALATDLLPTIVFAILLALHVDVRVATAVSVAISIGQIALMLVMKRPVAPLQWASLGLVIVFGAAGVLTNDARFLMVKPTLIYLIVGAVMLKRGWMLRYLPPMAQQHGAAAQIAMGYVWAGLMFVTAVANLVVAVWFQPQWPLFLATFPTGSKIALFVTHYLIVRHCSIRGFKAEAEAQAAAQAAAQPA